MALVGRLTTGTSRAGSSGAPCRRRARPPGEAGLRMARRALEETWLRFAKGAAAVAIVLSALAYASNGVSASALGQRGPQAGHGADRGGQVGWTAYRSARLLPTN